ncbi:hypothetical protein MHYP_G00194750 [Metynnis hypsauchen]
MYGFSGPVVTLPLHQSSQTLPRSTSRPHSHLEEEALVLSVPLSFQTVGSRPFWQSAQLCGQTENSWTCCCPASRSLCQSSDHHMTQVEASQPLPRVVKHKPSSIVFSDKSKAAQHNDLIRSECRLFNNEGSDREESKDNSGDNEDEDVYVVSLELQRQFLISHNRRDKNKARKVGPSHASVKTVQEASSSTTTKEEGVTVSSEQVQSRESVTLLIRKFDQLCLHIQEASLSGSFAWDKPRHTSAEVWDMPSSDSDRIFPNYSPNDHPVPSGLQLKALLFLLREKANVVCVLPIWQPNPASFAFSSLRTTHKSICLHAYLCHGVSVRGSWEDPPLALLLGVDVEYCTPVVSVG